MRIAKFFYPIVALLLLCASAVSCIVDEKRSFDFQQLPDSRWLRDDTLTFEVFIPSGGVPHEFTLLLRLNNEYDYLRLPFAYRLENDFGFSFSDSSFVVVADKPGDFSGFRTSYRQYEKTFALAVKPPIAGLYRIRIAPHTDRPVLRGVENVGLAIAPVSQTSTSPSSDSHRGN